MKGKIPAQSVERIQTLQCLHSDCTENNNYSEMESFSKRLYQGLIKKSLSEPKIENKIFGSPSVFIQCGPKGKRETARGWRLLQPCATQRSSNKDTRATKTKKEMTRHLISGFFKIQPVAWIWPAEGLCLAHIGSLGPT